MKVRTKNITRNSMLKRCYNEFRSNRKLRNADLRRSFGNHMRIITKATL